MNDNNEMLESTISVDDSRAELICAAAAITWDEVPMANKAAVASVDQVC